MDERMVVGLTARAEKRRVSLEGEVRTALTGSVRDALTPRAASVRAAAGRRRGIVTRRGPSA